MSLYPLDVRFDQNMSCHSLIEDRVVLFKGRAKLLKNIPISFIIDAIIGKDVAQTLLTP